MNHRNTAHQCARTIISAFARYNAEYRGLTRQTAEAFAARRLQAVQRAATERIELYDILVQQTVKELADALGDDRHSVMLWSAIKESYHRLIRGLVDRELNKTFFNSLTRRFFSTVGVNPLIEFVNIHVSPIDGVEGKVRLHRWTHEGGEPLAEAVLERFAQPLGLADVENDARALGAALALEEQRQHFGGMELLTEVFYRNTRCFLVGRMSTDSGWQPCMLCFWHGPEGVAFDALITDEDVISTLFGYARSYFHVDLEVVADTVVYLRRLLPHKPVSELYSVLGRAKQGKTERYREFMRHLRKAEDRFIVAPGSKGMVMAVFTLPSYDLVFKIIRDKFAYPKTVVRREVLESYELVFKHDRAGRLVDAQEFRQLRFPIQRFTEPVLEELFGECATTCVREGNDLVIRHLYIERRMEPLNLYLRAAEGERAAKAVLDYGQAIEDLALSNIFPGDLLLKNFGVTRQRRVIFYDYDELVLVTDCNFRRMPAARNEAEELSDEVWFEVRKNDIFPEQFEAFLGLRGRLLTLFRQEFPHLLDAAWWNGVKDRLNGGDVIDFRPYGPPQDGLVAPAPD